MFSEDLSAFFNTNEFAQTASLGGVAVQGILDLAPAIAFDVVGGAAPQFFLAAASVPADPRGLSLIVGATSYTVRDSTPDGTGVTILQLEAV